MFNTTDVSRTTQRVTCMLLSALIVITSLMVGAFAADAAAHPGYTVTITQIQ